MKSSLPGKLKRRKNILQLRRVEGVSMMPAFKPGMVVVATSLFRRLSPGDYVILKHDGIEKMKQIKHTRGDEIYVVGLNADMSTDSRHFGWLSVRLVIAKVLR